MKRFKTSIVFILSLACLQAAAGQELDNYLAKLYRDHVVPGFSVVVVLKDQVVFSKGYGYEYADTRIAMSSATSTAIGSLTKSFTALAIMQLVEEGKLKLDDPVVKHLPGFRTANKDLSDRVTVRMLLNNTSGLKAPQVRNRDNSEDAAEYLLASLESVYLRSEPGTHYEYSNDGFALAGLIISRLSGMSYSAYLEEMIFAPLEMDRSTNDPEEFETLQVLYGHYTGIDKALPLHHEDELLREYTAAGSMLRSSAEDIGHYLLAMINAGQYKGKQLVSPESIQEMWRSYSEFPGIPVEDGGEDLPLHYGLGWFMGELDGKHYVFHGGNRRNMSSMTFIYPEEQIGISILCNMDLTLIDRYSYPNLIHIANNIVRISLGEAESDFALPLVSDPSLNSYTLPAHMMDKYTGRYIMAEGNDWVYRGSQLFIEQGAGGLVGTVQKGEQLIEEFGIDFLTPGTAVSRNLTMPREIKFKFSGEGEVMDLFVGGNKYFRITDAYREKFQAVASDQGRVGFHLPISWKVDWTGDTFKGRHQEFASETIAGQLFHGDQSIREYFGELFPAHHILHSGQVLSEIRGLHFWKQLALVSTRDQEQFHHFACVTKMEQMSYVIVLTSKQNLTASVAQLIPALLDTFSWDLHPGPAHK